MKNRSNLILENTKIESLDSLRDNIVNSVNDLVPSKVRMIKISQYKKGDNTLNLHIFCDYIKNAENLELHNPKSSFKDRMIANKIIKDMKMIQGSIKKAMLKFHKFDTLTVDIYPNRSNTKDTLVKYAGLIRAYKNKQTIYCRK